MIYKPRKPQWVSAIEFNGSLDDNQFSVLGVSRIPPNVNGQCQCGRPLSDHAIIGRNLICPGSYIMYEGGQVTNVMSKENFESIYQPLIVESEITEVGENVKE